MEQNYAQMIDEALFECDLDLHLAAKVIDVTSEPERISCTVQFAKSPTLDQQGALLIEIQEGIGPGCSMASIPGEPERIIIEIPIAGRIN